MLHGHFVLTEHTRPSTVPRVAAWLCRGQPRRRSASRPNQRRGRGCHPFRKQELIGTKTRPEETPPRPGHRPRPPHCDCCAISASRLHLLLFLPPPPLLNCPREVHVSKDGWDFRDQSLELPEPPKTLSNQNCCNCPSYVALWWSTKICLLIFV
jgi:hypothetical protein